MRKANGFSLLELILVIIVISALIAIAVPRFTSQDRIAQHSFSQQIIVALRYAQKLAISSGCEIQVNVNPATNSFTVNRRSGGSATNCGASGNAFTDAVASPAGSGSFAGTAPNNVDISSGLTVIFNSLGVPSAGGAIAVGNQTITVEANTGYVR